ncbi:MAG: PHP domain-containing protein [Bacteroidota bacterium]|nr:PHP domain-containing protein [Bacteroidota bacterium]MDP4226764.1 PHP domain-containing protein [Bacteroidota bacterium]MDP4273584.1 PHP domain-containing protein [Bacteroidota bacterium]
MINIFKIFPSEIELLKWQEQHPSNGICQVNGHIHTPYSFSAFRNIPQAFEMARKEGIKILGINDFYTTDGYNEFYENALKNKVFPLFNIEFMGLSKEQQKLGIRVNDPGNPGRTYFSGKGLTYPLSLGQDNLKVLSSVMQQSQEQVMSMISKANEHLQSIGSDIHLDYEDILKNYAKKQVRERHIAKVLRIKILEKYTQEEACKDFLKQLYSGKDTAVDIHNNNALENELRSNLLKAGGKAFVPEDEKAFLSISQIKNLIIEAGGIPCYPVLLDDKNGKFTEFEADKKKMLSELIDMNIGCIELIPGRNSQAILKDFVMFFRENGFAVTFGTEHNSPELIPLTVDCRGHEPLDKDLQKINYEGACIIAAHQYLKAQGKMGFLDENGNTRAAETENFIRLGKAVVNYFIYS